MAVGRLVLLHTPHLCAYREACGAKSTSMCHILRNKSHRHAVVIKRHYIDVSHNQKTTIQHTKCTLTANGRRRIQIYYPLHMRSSKLYWTIYTLICVPWWFFVSLQDITYEFQRSCMLIGRLTKHHHQPIISQRSRVDGCHSMHSSTVFF